MCASSVGKEPGAVHRLLADQHRRDHRDEPFRGEDVHARGGPARTARTRCRPSGRRTASRWCARRARCRACPAASPSATWSLRLEVERRRLAAPSHLDGVLVGEAVGRAAWGTFGVAASSSLSDASACLELRLELLELGADLADLGDQRAASRRPGRRQSPSTPGSAQRAAPPTRAVSARRRSSARRVDRRPRPGCAAPGPRGTARGPRGSPGRRARYGTFTCSASVRPALPPRAPACCPARRAPAAVHDALPVEDAALLDHERLRGDVAVDRARRARGAPCPSRPRCP